MARSYGERIPDAAAEAALSAAQAASTAAEPASREVVRKELCALVSEQGASVIDNRLRCRNLIRDYCIADRGAANILIAALDRDVPVDLRVMNSGKPSVSVASLIRRLEADCGQTEGAARWAVESWALALGAGGLPGRPIPIAASLIRSFWYRPVVPLLTAAILIGLETLAYFPIASKIETDTTASTSEAAALREILSQKSIFPGGLSWKVNSQLLNNSEINAAMRIMFILDNRTGHASGTIIEGGKSNNFDWQLHMTRIETVLADKRVKYLVLTDDRNGYFLEIETEQNGNISFQVCKENQRHSLDCFTWRKP